MLKICYSMCNPWCDKAGVMQDEIEKARHRLDEILASQWLRNKKSSVTMQTWISSHKDVLGAVFPRKDIDDLLALQGDNAEQQARVRRLAASGSLGEALFESSLDEFSAHDFAMQVKGKVNELRENGLRRRYHHRVEKRAHDHGC